MKTKTKTLSTVIEDLFGDALSWDDHDDTTGYIPCPGRDKHTHKDGRRDCRVYLSGAPTIWCLHNSCEEDVKDANENLRGALRAQGFEPPPMTAEKKDRMTSKEINERTARRVTKNVEFLRKEYRWTRDEIRMPEIADLAPSVQFDLFISKLFGRDDILWMGAPCDTGAGFASRFAKRTAWVKRHNMMGAGPFIAPNPFTPGTHDRRIENLAAKKYFVVEGDDCSPDKDENRDHCGAIFKYAMADAKAGKPQLKLRAVVDAGNKSLHGWFEYPDDATYKWCVDVLPALGADPATMRLTQPVRLPGVTRNNGNEQTLLWISK